MTQLWKGEEIFRSDCELQIALSDIDFFKDDATACDLIMQSRCHKFIPTLSILKKILTLCDPQQNSSAWRTENCCPTVCCVVLPY